MFLIQYSTDIIGKLVYDIDHQDESYESLLTKYYIQVFLINVFNTIIVFSLALFFHTFSLTFISQLSYSILRKKAYGWHANKLLHCSLFGILLFVFYPINLQTICPNPSLLLFAAITLFSNSVFYVFSPSETKKKIIKTETERSTLKIASLIRLNSIIAIGVIFQSFRLGILIGITSAILTILINEIERRKKKMNKVKLLLQNNMNKVIKNEDSVNVDISSRSYCPFPKWIFEPVKPQRENKVK